jgi:hypothetical protein
MYYIRYTIVLLALECRRERGASQVGYGTGKPRGTGREFSLEDGHFRGGQVKTMHGHWSRIYVVSECRAALH